MPETTLNDYDRFFVGSGEALNKAFSEFTHPGDAVPAMCTSQDWGGHTLETAWYDGPSYFERLMKQADELMNSPSGGYWWMHGWYFQLFAVESILKFGGYEDLPAPYQLMESRDPWSVYYKAESLSVKGTLFADKLKQMRNKGVEVRIIGWIPPIMLKSKAIVEATKGLHKIKVKGVEYDTPGHIFDRNVGTVHSLLRLREAYLDNYNVIFNTLTHPLGGAHTKFVIAGNGNFQRAFIGGIDAGPSRNKPTWSDAAFAVEGKAATKAAEFFKLLWNDITGSTAINFHFGSTPLDTKKPEEIAYKSYPTHFGNKISTPIPDVKPSKSQGLVTDASLQLFRTVPIKRYANPNASVEKAKRYLAGVALAKKNKVNIGDLGKVGKATFQLPHVWTPPLTFAPDGIFEYKRVIFKALMAAEKYIYIMDQAPSNFEFAKAINLRIKELRKNNVFLKVIVLTPIHEDGDLEGGHGLTKEELDALSDTERDAIREEERIEKENAIQHKYRKQFKLFEIMADGIPRRDFAKHFIWIDSATHAKVVLIDDKFVTIGSANFMLRSAYTDIEMGAAILHDTWVKNFRKGMWSWFSADGAKVTDDLDIAIRMWSATWKASGNPSTQLLAQVTSLHPKVKGVWIPNDQQGTAAVPGVINNLKFDAVANLKPMVEDPNSNVEI
ncbi:MAG: phospholipase D-like domain-containing protein [Bacteroidia bacterium]